MEWLEILAIKPKAPPPPEREFDPEQLIAEFATLREVKRPCRRHRLLEWLCTKRGRPEWACFDPRPCIPQDGRQDS